MARERERLFGIAAAEARSLHAAAEEAAAGVDEAIATLDQVRAGCSCLRLLCLSSCLGPQGIETPGG